MIFSSYARRTLRTVLLEGIIEHRLARQVHQDIDSLLNHYLTLTIVNHIYLSNTNYLAYSYYIAGVDMNNRFSPLLNQSAINRNNRQSDDDEDQKDETSYSLK
jgi:hypothetical protein